MSHSQGTRLVDILRFPIAVLKHIRLTIFLFLLFWMIPGSTLNINDRWYAIAFHISDYNFDYIGWEANAIGGKFAQTLWGLHPFLSEDERTQYVRVYMADIARAQQLEAQINTIFVDPGVEDPESESAELRFERDALRRDLANRQWLAEAILEGQVATILVEEGFDVGGQLLPPMSMHFTQVPNLLIVSPREAIQFDVSLNLVPLPVDRKAEIEDFLDETYEISTLIVPLGGIALYPAMILETTSITYAIEVFAHEWAHHYLFFYPLGLSYFTGGDGFASEARIINETTADFFGKVIAQKVIARYYPDLPIPQLPQVNDPDTQSAGTLTAPDPDVFNFGATMNETRVTVDALLAEGKVDEAEAYMEQQRQLFVTNGYNIRKLNQAYFAFYGGYQSGDIPGIGGQDPIGPNVRAVLDGSVTIHDYIVALRGITTRAELEQVAKQFR